VGLSDLEDNLRTLNTRQFNERDQQIRSDISKKVGTLRDKTADAEAPQRVAEKERNRLLYEAEDFTESQRAIKDRAESDLVAAKTDQAEFGNEIKSSRGKESDASIQFDEQYNAARAARGEKVGDKFAEAQDGQTVDIEPIRDVIESVNSEVNRLGFDNTGIPKQFALKVQDILETDGKVSAKEVGELRGEISLARDRAKRAGNTKLAKSLEELKSGISKTLKEQVPGQVEADAVYAEEFAPFFKSGAGGKVAGLKNKSTDTKPYSPSDTVGYFLDGKPESAADLAKIVEIAPNKKAAGEAVERYMIAKMATDIGENPTPRAIRRWMDLHTDELASFPDLEQKFTTMYQKAGSLDDTVKTMNIQLKDAAEAAKKAENNIIATERRINNGVLGTLINEDPNKYVKSIMGSKNPVKQIKEVKKLIGNDKQAMAGFKRAVTEDLIKRVTNTNDRLVNMDAREVGSLSSAKITNLMRDNEAALKEIYTPSEMNTLRRMQDILGASGNLARKSTKGSDTAAKQAKEDIMLALETGLRLKFGMLKGGGIMSTIRRAKKAMGGDTKSEQLVARVMFDPDVAKFLLEMDLKDPVRSNKKLLMLLGISVAGKAASRKGEMNELNTPIQEDDEE
jgi:hypothetical protein